MENLAILFKILNLYAHAGHNLVSKAVFMPDHEMLADLYAAYDSEYDAIIERMMGLDQPVDITGINVKACQVFATLPLTLSENGQFFQKIVELEKALQDAINKIYPAASIGTQQLIGEQANQSEMRLYKLKQRLKK